MARIQDIAPELLQFTEAEAPSTPASGVVRIYAKTDGKLYCKDDAGNEYALVGAAAADVGIADSDELFTATDVEGALEELFTSVSSGKDGLVTDVETMGGSVEVAGSHATFSELSAGILSIPAGGESLLGYNEKLNPSDYLPTPTYSHSIA